MKLSIGSGAHTKKTTFAGESSYSSHGEDTMFIGALNRLSWLMQSDQFAGGTYLDIGSHNPIMGSNTYSLYRRGWRGTLVEPIQSWIKDYESFRQGDLVISCAVAMESGERKLYKFSDLASSNTLSKSFADEISAAQDVRIESEDFIQCLTLGEVLDLHIDSFGVVPRLMSIDIEGLDYEVARSYAWDIRPTFVMIEDPELTGAFHGGKLTKLMTSNGYRPISHALITTLFVDAATKESDALMHMGPLAVKQ